MNPVPEAVSFSRRDRWFLGFLLAVGLVVGARGIIHHGYIGQDFDGPEGHHFLIRTFPGTYSFKLTNPPGLYAVGHFVFRYLTQVDYLEVIASGFLLMNLAALAGLYRLIWKMIEAWPLRFAAATLVTFVPFRTIHAIVIAADAFTLPLFVLIAACTLRLCENPKGGFAWIGLTLSLTVAVCFKYTFIGTFPPIGLLLLVAIFRRVEKEKRLRWLGIAAVALAIPTAVFQLEMQASRKVQGVITSGIYLRPDMESAMRWQDILTLQKTDRAIFSAPEYFRDELYEFRYYSYPALMHVATFTDCQCYFQPPPKKISANWRQRVHDSFQRDRSVFSRRWQQRSVAWCIPDTLFGIIGTIFCGTLSVWSLITRKPPAINSATVVATLLALGFYAPVFLSLHRIADVYNAGYWLPRLVLPAIVLFLVLGFVLLDQVARRVGGPLGKAIGYAALAHTAAAGAIFVSFLI